MVLPDLFMHRAPWAPTAPLPTPCWWTHRHLPLAEVPFQVRWGRQICHEMAKVIVFIICITQSRVGCGFKGIWLSFIALVYLAAAYQVICKVICCPNAGINALQIFYLYKKEKCFILRKVWFTMSGKQEQSTSKKGQLYSRKVICLT